MGWQLVNCHPDVVMCFCCIHLSPIYLPGRLFLLLEVAATNVSSNPSELSRFVFSEVATPEIRSGHTTATTSRRRVRRAVRCKPVQDHTAIRCRQLSAFLGRFANAFVRQFYLFDFQVLGVQQGDDVDEKVDDLGPPFIMEAGKQVPRFFLDRSRAEPY